MTNDSPEYPSTDEPRLIFHWDRVGGARRRLTVTLVVALLGHVMLFYLFRVVTPPAPRKPPPQQAMWYLPQIEGAAGIPPPRHPGPPVRGADDDLAADAAALAALVPPWQSVIAALTPPMRPFELPTVDLGLPVLPETATPLLPPLPEPEEAASPPAPSPGTAATESIIVPAVELQSGFSGRGITRSAEWPASLFDDSWQESASVPFMLGVDAAGIPKFCLPLSPTTGVDIESLRRQLMQMRFEPRPSGALAWGTLEVRW